jgi:hypothetical protein
MPWVGHGVARSFAAIAIATLACACGKVRAHDGEQEEPAPDGGRCTFAGYGKPVVSVPSHPPQTLLAIPSKNGHDDLVVGEHDGDWYGYEMLSNAGNGTFSSRSAPIDEFASIRAVADVDGDGTADIIARDRGRIRLRLSTPARFAADPRDVQLPRPFGEVALGDFDGDGLRDFVFAGFDQVYTPPEVNDQDFAFFFLQNVGSESFDAVSVMGTAGAATNIVSGDFDGDGDLDVLQANGDYGVSFTTLRNAGDGSFDAVTTGWTGATLGLLLAADLDGDGTPEAIRSYTANNDVFVVVFHRGDVTGASGVDTYNVGNIGAVTSTGDFNGDGTIDVATVGQTHDPGNNPMAVTVLENTGDGTLRVGPTYSFVDEETWSPNGFTTSDFNGDGVPDFAMALDDRLFGTGSSVRVMLSQCAK